jgi:glycine/D-amino acid oxidase-like deaminating enzyme
VHIYPFLEHVNMVRAWSALRVMSEDGYPVYERSLACPGAAVVTCHSGVTLAAAHALELAPWLISDDRLPAVKAFTLSRFAHAKN